MISVILVNYNGAADTLECIMSIQKSIEVDYRIIVVDNSSSDDSLDVLRNYSKKVPFILIVAKDNNGFSAGNNLGILEALRLGTDYVLLLNNDTIVEPFTLRELIQGIERHGCSLTIGKIKYADNRDRIWYAGGSFNKLIAKARHWHYQEVDNVDMKNDLEVYFATGCCLCMTVATIQKIGLMDEDYFLYEEDADYCLRIINSGHKMFYIPKAIIYHKVNASTKKIPGVIGYYMFRNKLMLINKRYHGVEKIPAYIYAILRGIYGCIKGEQSIDVFLLALFAFCNKERGKSSRYF